LGLQQRLVGVVLVAAELGLQHGDLVAQRASPG